MELSEDPKLIFFIVNSLVVFFFSIWRDDIYPARKKDRKLSKVNYFSRFFLRDRDLYSLIEIADSLPNLYSEI